MLEPFSHGDGGSGTLGTLTKAHASPSTQCQDLIPADPTGSCTIPKLITVASHFGQAGGRCPPLPLGAGEVSLTQTCDWRLAVPPGEGQTDGKQVASPTIQSARPPAFSFVRNHWTFDTSPERASGYWRTPRSLEPVVMTLLSLGPTQHPSHLARQNFSASVGLDSLLQHLCPSLHPE